MLKARSFAQQYCIKRAGLLLHKTKAIWPKCRIGVALSGGVDSFVLLQVLKIRQSLLPFPVEIMAIHLDPGFNGNKHQSLIEWLALHGIPSHIEMTDFGPRAHSSENRSASTCFYCAWLRRKRLFILCQEYNLTHLAMGHNADDLASTFMLNLFKNGRVQGMAPNESFFDGKLRMIRPLLMVEKKYILQAAKQWQLPVWANVCPSSGHTARAQMERLLMKIDNEVPGVRKSMINGLCRWELQQGFKDITNL